MPLPQGTERNAVGASWLLRILITLLALFLVLPGVALLGSDDSGGTVAGVILLVCGLGLIGFIWWQQTGVQITLRDDGIEYKGRLTQKGIRWADCAAYIFMPQQRQYYGGGLVGIAVAIAVEAATKNDPAQQLPMAVTLIGADRTRIRVSGLISDHKNIGNQLVQTATEHIFASSRQRFDAGEPVLFGKLTVAKSGLTWNGAFGQKTLAWNELERAQMIERRHFVLRKLGKGFPWLRVGLQGISSPFALVRLLNHARETQLPQLSPAVAGGAVQHI